MILFEFQYVREVLFLPDVSYLMVHPEILQYIYYISLPSVLKAVLEFVEASNTESQRVSSADGKTKGLKVEGTPESAILDKRL